MKLRSFEASKLRGFEAFVTEIEISIFGFENSTLLIVEISVDALQKYKLYKHLLLQDVRLVDIYVFCYNKRAELKKLGDF